MPASPERLLARRARLRERLDAAGLAGMAVTKPVNVRYLAGFTGSAGALVVLPDRAVLLTDPRYGEQAALEVPEAEVRVTRGDLIEAVAAVLAAAPAPVGFEPEGLTWGAGQRLRARRPEGALRPAPGLVEELRRVKDPEELAAMRQAAAIGTDALQEVLGGLREGVTEREVADRLEAALRRRGAEALAFPSIVAFGEQAAQPHHPPGDRPLRRGDLVKLDFGGRVDGYCSDMTRTVAFGRASERQREVYEVVRRAQAAGLAALRAGVTAGAVDAACREVIAGAGLGEAFSHPTGHGVGLEIHEAPILRAGSDGTIPAGTPITVEPGVYLPGFGGVRIEDLAVVQPDGHELLTTAPKDLLEL